MFTVLILMAAGILLGFAVRNKTKIHKAADPLVNVAIYLLLFLLGISVGTNKAVINNLDTLGLQGLFLTLGGITGSVILAFFTYKIFFKTKK